MCLQDYSDAFVVEVKGQATLKLINNQSNIKMESQTALVCDDDGRNENDAYDMIIYYVLHFSCSSKYK